MKHLFVVAVLVFTPVPGATQSSPGHEEGAAPATTFRAGTELVALSVTVTDAKAQHLPGLTASDFVVLEDGVQQPLSFFAVSKVPVDLTLLVDASASMRDKIVIARQAVKGLAGALRPEDRASLVEFRDRVVRRQGMTDDAQAIEAALGAITPEGGTALYNAVYVALSEFKARPRPGGPLRRQAIVVLSDGEDTASLIGYEDMVEQARRRGVTVYAVALRSSDTLAAARARTMGLRALTEADYAMRTLARETGGQAFFAKSIEELEGIYDVIATELDHQYALGYVPRNATRDGAWRRIQVRIPSHPSARLRTRSGYFAQPKERVVFAVGSPGSPAQ